MREPAVADVEVGIDRVYGLLAAKKLLVCASLAGLRDQLGSYSRVLDANGNPTEAIEDKETFHFADALRYRYDSYDYALDHLLIETPYPVARTVDLDLKRLEVEVAIAERGDFCGTGEVRSGSPDLRELSILPRYEHEAPPRAGPQVGS